MGVSLSDHGENRERFPLMAARVLQADPQTVVSARVRLTARVRGVGEAYP
jgi:hypothetical protein